MFWANSSDDISKIRNSYNIQPLKKVENYEIWFIRVHALLTENGLTSYVTISNHDMKAIIENQQSKNKINHFVKFNRRFANTNSTYSTFI